MRGTAASTSAARGRPPRQAWTERRRCGFAPNTRAAPMIRRRMTRWTPPCGGPGRRGWPAECVAMALSTFGVGVDVHPAGNDLSSPHHAYHSAMAEAFTGVSPYARAWLHVGVVTVDGVKMAKSVGNLVLVGDLLADHTAAALRLMILDRPWAEDWDYSVALLAAAAARLADLYRAAGRTRGTSQHGAGEGRRLLGA